MATEETKFGTTIKKCTCKHTYQDKRYGVGMRVHNYSPGGKKGGKGYVCTVCQKRPLL